MFLNLRICALLLVVAGVMSCNRSIGYDNERKFINYSEVMLAFFKHNSNDSFKARIVEDMSLYPMGVGAYLCDYSDLHKYGNEGWAREQKEVKVEEGAAGVRINSLILDYIRSKKNRTVAWEEYCGIIKDAFVKGCTEESQRKSMILAVHSINSNRSYSHQYYGNDLEIFQRALNEDRNAIASLYGVLSEKDDYLGYSLGMIGLGDGFRDEYGISDVAAQILLGHEKKAMLLHERLVLMIEKELVVQGYIESESKRNLSDRAFYVRLDFMSKQYHKMNKEALLVLRKNGDISDSELMLLCREHVKSCILSLTTDKSLFKKVN